MPAKISHIELNVADLSRSLAFYGKLGFEALETAAKDGEIKRTMLKPREATVPTTMLLLVVQGLEGTYSRLQLVGLYAAAGASAALLSVLGQLVFRRAAEPRSSVSGAVMGLLVLRAAVAPQELLSVGRWQLPIARLLAMHLLLDAGTNAPHEGLGLGKLLDLLGGALMVAAVVRPQLALADGGWRRYADWRLLLDYAKSAL